MKGIVFVFFVLVMQSLPAQDLGVLVKGNYALSSSSKSANLFHNDGAIEVQYGLKKKNFDLLFSGGLRVINWGNQLDFSIGARKYIYLKEKVKLYSSIKPYLIVPLVYNETLFGYAVELNGGVYYALSKKIDIGMSTGFRLDSLPNYKQYGPIYNIFGFQYGIELKYNFQSQDQTK